MSDNRILNQHELYLLRSDGDTKTLLYAPLADSCLYVTPQDIQQLTLALTNPDDENLEEDYREVAEALTDVVPVIERGGHIRTMKDFVNLSLLPNNICNFSCSYCYSAYGRSTRQLTWTQLEAMLRYFFSEERRPFDGERLHVTIFGGGEPLLSWDRLVRPALIWLDRYRQSGGRPFTITLITNGSMLPDGFIDFAKRLGMDLVCSYEILREVQDVQRRHYDLVTRNIKTLIRAGVIPAFNSVVTPLNVARQREMVEEVHQCFPPVRWLAFEPVIDVVPEEQRKDFYDSFIVHFDEARKAAAQYGINLSCSTLRNVDVTVDRYCAGELALIADGSISVCPCVSAPEEALFESYTYGRVSESGEISIDKDRLQRLLHQDVYSQPWCKDCFAKWNCGGGCTHGNQKRGNRPDPDYCHFMRSFLKKELERRMEEMA